MAQKRLTPADADFIMKLDQVGFSNSEMARKLGVKIYAPLDMPTDWMEYSGIADFRVFDDCLFIIRRYL